MKTGSITWLAAAALVIAPALAGAASTKTVTDLKAAYKGETTASAKYAAYAKKADQEGYLAVAGLFRAASRAEKIHAANHRAAMASLGVKAPTAGSYTAAPGSTAANLRDAVKGETYEKTVMYPAFIKDAKAEGQSQALESFTYAINAEKQHAQLYTSALKELGRGQKQVAYFVCPVCGATYPGAAPALCPTCATPKERFLKIS